MRLHPPPPAKYNQIELPLTNLHYVSCGDGPPLIMVPATISKISHWLPLVQFMAQRFRVYFFELPGHGKSSPFPTAYSSQLVAKSVGDFIDQLGHKAITLLGFSFGGILAMHTLNHLQDQIERVILISPCVSAQAVVLSKTRKYFLQKLLMILKSPRVQGGLVRLLHNQSIGFSCAALIRRLGKVEGTIELEDTLCNLPASTLEVLINQAYEILTLEFRIHKPVYPQTCFFAMSVNDPVLDFNTTHDFLENNFQELITERFTFPYHQPPVLPTYPELNRDYGHFLSLI